MSNLQHDASTDIDAVVAKFNVDMTKSASDLLKLAANKAPAGSKLVVVRFSLSRNPVTRFRTPAQQAAEVAKGSSSVCWSAHMADRARDVMMLVNGTYNADPKRVFGTQYAAFTKAWGENMRKWGLKNCAGKDGWNENDKFHLELPDTKVARTDDRARACLQEYVRLTRFGGKKPNAHFEQQYKAMLKPFLENAAKRDNAG